MIEPNPWVVAGLAVVGIPVLLAIMLLVAFSVGTFIDDLFVPSGDQHEGLVGVIVGTLMLFGQVVGIGIAGSYLADNL